MPLAVLDFPPRVMIPDDLEPCFVDATTGQEFGCVVTTYAGGAEPDVGDGGSAIEAHLFRPEDVLIHDGRLYISDSLHNRVRMVDEEGIIHTVAGSGPNRGAFFEGLPAVDTPLSHPAALGTGPEGLLYFTLSKGHMVVRLEEDGTLTRVAGHDLVDGQIGGDIGDGRPAVGAELLHPHGFVFDQTGTLIIADTSHHRIRRVDRRGVITTLIGTGEFGNHGDGGPGLAAAASDPEGIAIDSEGRIHFTGAPPRFYDPRTGIIMSSRTYPNLGGTDLAIHDGYIYFVSRGGHRVVRVLLDDYVAQPLSLVDLDDCSEHQGSLGGRFWVSLNRTDGEWFDADVDDCGHFYKAVLPGTYDVEFLHFGTDDQPGDSIGHYAGDGEEVAQEAQPVEVAPGEAVAIEVILPGVGRVSGILESRAPGAVEVVAGTGEPGFSGDGGPATLAQLDTPGGIAFGPDGDLYIADSLNHRVRVVARDGTITTVAGSPSPLLSTEPVPFDETWFNTTTGMIFDAAGNLYVTDYDFSIIRRVATTGYVTRVAGSGRQSSSGDGGSPLLADFDSPGSPAFDGQGNLFVEDTAVRRISPGADGVVDGSPDEVVTRVAGIPRGFEEKYGTCLESVCAQYGFTTTTDGVPALEAIWNQIYGHAIDPAGNLWIVDWRDHRLLKVTPGADGLITGEPDEIISVVAGTGFPSSTGNGGPVGEATINHPQHVVTDAEGNVFFVEWGPGGGGIRRVDAATGIIDRYGVGAPAVGSLVVDPNGVVYFTDSIRVYRIDPVSGEISVVAGDGTGGWGNEPGGFAGDGGDAREAKFRYIAYLAVAPNGDLIVDDTGNYRLRRITFVPLER